VRQGLKEFSNWKTYPQLYHNGTLIGGVDIIKELAEVAASRTLHVLRVELTLVTLPGRWP